MSRQTGGEAVVQALVDHGFTTLFGLPGIQNDWLFNALYDAGDALRVIHTRHEQGAAYMALGHALATGEPSLCSVVPGPGVLNASAALATAYALNAPVLLLAGQIPSSEIGGGRGALHEIPDQLGLLRSLTKWAGRVDAPAQAAEQIDQAVHELRSGRPRPVAVEVPMDVLARREATAAAAPPREPFAPPVDQDLIDEAARVLSAAKEPMIFVGSGAQGVSTEVRELAERLQAPVVAYRTGRGVLDSRHPLSLVQPAARPLWPSADAILALGTNMRVPLRSWPQEPERRFVRIDVDPTSHQVQRAPDVAVTARLEDALPQLLERLEAHDRRRPSREEQVRAVRAAWEAKSAVLQPQVAFLAAIRDALGEDGIFVDELTQVGFASRIVMPVYRPRTFLSTGYMGTLGYGFPTALGAKVARPDVPVVSVTGDGGFLFALSELATAVQHGIALVTVVFNNDRYGNVQQMQRELYGGRVIASDLRNPTFPALAESFGALGLRAESPAALRGALQTALESGRPAVVEVPVGDMPSVDQFR